MKLFLQFGKCNKKYVGKFSHPLHCFVLNFLKIKTLQRLFNTRRFALRLLVFQHLFVALMHAKLPTIESQWLFLLFRVK